MMTMNPVRRLLKGDKSAEDSAQVAAAMGD